MGRSDTIAGFSRQASALMDNRRIIFILGAQGAGKTTAMERLRKHPKIVLIKSFTTRARRFEGEDEYDHVENAMNQEVAWCVQRKSGTYGVLVKELNRINAQCVGVVPFDPECAAILPSIVSDNRLNASVIALDNIRDAEEQNKRVKFDPDRMINNNRLELIRKVLSCADFIIDGDSDTTAAALEMIAERFLKDKCIGARLWKRAYLKL